jgi:hypothetical protein
MVMYKIKRLGIGAVWIAMLGIIMFPGCSQQGPTEIGIDRQEVKNVDPDRQKPIDETDIDWKELAAGYNPPSIGGLLESIKESNITVDGNVVITPLIKREFNQMGRDYSFFFMPEVAWYDFESIGTALSYTLFMWTGEFGTFPERAPQYEAEARLRKMFAAPNNEYPQIEHQTYFKCVRYDGESYVPWPESYNNDAMVYDLVELRLRKEGDRIYYTATADEYGFNVNGIGYYELGENEKFLIAQAEALGLDYNATLEKLLATGEIINAMESITYEIEFRIEGNNTVPMIVSVDRLLQ